MCVDYGALNSITKKFKYPLPLIEDLLHILRGYQCFITLDLSNRYYQVPIDLDSGEKSAFVTPDGHYEFTQMPFELKNAPSKFQKLLNEVFEYLEKDVVFVFIDIIIPARSVKEGRHKLRAVLKRLRLFNLTLKLSKWNFFQRKLEYLGCEISCDGVRPGTNKVQPLKICQYRKIRRTFANF